ALMSVSKFLLDDFPKPLPHQQEAIHIMVQKHQQRKSILLADEMGLGKTLEAIEFFVFIVEKNNKIRKNYNFLVICPLSVLSHWKSESLRCFYETDIFELDSEISISKWLQFSERLQNNTNLLKTRVN